MRAWHWFWPRKPWRPVWRPASSPRRYRAAPPSRRRSRETAGPRGRAASLVRGAFFQPVLETAIEIGVDRKVVGEELGVDLHHLGEALAFLPAVDTHGGDGERHHRQDHPRGQPAPAPA